MNTSNSVVEFEDDLTLAACEFRWSKGDKFALIEAVAICAANDLQYPRWVRTQIDAAMTGLFEAVFPDGNLKDGRPGLGISNLPEGNELADMKTRFRNGVKDASKQLSLTLDRRSPVETHIKAVRNFYLAELVARFAEFQPLATAQFANVSRVKNELAGALFLTLTEWQDRVSAKNDFGPINEKTIPFHTVEPICRMATFDVIDDAWDKYKEFFLDDRTAKFEDDHGVNLSE